MSTTPKLLDEAFQNSLNQAAALDQQGVIPPDTHDLFPDHHQPTHVELIQASRDFYNEHHVVMDRAIKGVLNFLNSPEGAARMKALEASLNASDEEALSTQITELMNSGALDVQSATEAQALTGFGIGVSAGVSAVIGLLAGADIVFESDDVIFRTWTGGSFKGGLSVSAGLEMSFWVTTPLSGFIGGWLHDVYLLSTSGYFFRIMYIKQRASGSTNSEFGGMSFQFPFGFGFPIRDLFGKDLKLTAGWAGKQNAQARTKAATLTVINKTTGTNTIAVNQTVVLTATLTNTSGKTVSLGPGSTIQIRMPNYFTSADISKMSTSLTNFTFTNDGTYLTLTSNTTLNWANNTDIVLGIGNVHSSNTPVSGQQATPGFVTIQINAPSLSDPIVATAAFNLVWAASQSTLTWQTNVVSPMKLNGLPSGSQVANAQPGNTVAPLTTATDTSTGDVWTLGYIYNYNTSGANQGIPQIAAAWSKQGAPQVGSNVIVGNFLTASGTTSCFNSTGSSISIKVTFST